MDEEFDYIGDYIQVLSDSDLTLCPASTSGSAETHRIYEALSLGSIPVVQDYDVTACANNDPLHLLRESGAPVLFVGSPDDLRTVLAGERAASIQEKIARRAAALNWYAAFRNKTADLFVRVVQWHVGPS